MNINDNCFSNNSGDLILKNEIDVEENNIKIPNSILEYPGFDKFSSPIIENFIIICEFSKRHREKIKKISGYAIESILQSLYTNDVSPWKITNRKCLYSSMVETYKQMIILKSHPLVKEKKAHLALRVKFEFAIKHWLINFYCISSLYSTDTFIKLCEEDRNHPYNIILPALPTRWITYIRIPYLLEIEAYLYSIIKFEKKRKNYSKKYIILERLYHKVDKLIKLFDNEVFMNSFRRIN